ncbi:MAG: hypothetical protein R2880_09070 [Deinococcales bacterium]
MLILAGILTVIYAFVNAFGAWMVIRRKPWIGWLFMLASAILVSAASAFLAPNTFALTWLSLGLITASLTSLLNAHFVMGKITPRNHLIRLAVALVIFILAFFGLG